MRIHVVLDSDREYSKNPYASQQFTNYLLGNNQQKIE